MVFDFYHDHAQPLDRIQVGKHLIVRSSSPSNCIICGTKTFWCDSEDMKPVCEKLCLRQLHKPDDQINAGVAFIMDTSLGGE